MNSNKSKDWHIKMRVTPLRKIVMIKLKSTSNISTKTIKVWIILWITQYRMKLSPIKKSVEMVELPRKCSKTREFTTMIAACSHIWKLDTKIIILTVIILNRLINCLKMEIMLIIMFIKWKVVLMAAIKLLNINKIWKTLLKIIEDSEWLKIKIRLQRFTLAKNGLKTKNTAKIN